MEKVIFDSDIIEQTRQTQFVSAVFQKYQSTQTTFTASNAYSSLHGYGRCGISGFVHTIETMMNTIESEITKIDQFVISSVGNYQGLESAVQERSSRENMDSESLMGALSSLPKLSDGNRDYASEDSFAILQFEPVFSEPTTSSGDVTANASIASSIVYGSSVSKGITEEDSGYQVSSIYRAKPLVGEEDSVSYDPNQAVEDYSSHFQTSSSFGTLSSSETSNYTQGESSI